MNMTLATACAAALSMLMSWSGPAKAQTIYKCRLNDSIMYSDMPCAAGGQMPMPSSAPARSISQERLARESLRQQREADRLAMQRHQAEARAQRQQDRAAKNAARAREKCAHAQLQKKWADDELSSILAGAHFNARARHGSVQQARLKAQHAAEKMALACPT